MGANGGANVPFAWTRAVNAASLRNTLLNAAGAAYATPGHLDGKEKSRRHRGLRKKRKVNPIESNCKLRPRIKSTIWQIKETKSLMADTELGSTMSIFPFFSFLY